MKYIKDQRVHSGKTAKEQSLNRFDEYLEYLFAKEEVDGIICDLEKSFSHQYNITTEYMGKVYTWNLDQIKESNSFRHKIIILRPTTARNFDGELNTILAQIALEKNIVITELASTEQDEYEKADIPICYELSDLQPILSTSRPSSCKYIHLKNRAGLIQTDMLYFDLLASIDMTGKTILMSNSPNKIKDVALLESRLNTIENYRSSTCYSIV